MNEVTDTQQAIVNLLQKQMGKKPVVEADFDRNIIDVFGMAGDDAQEFITAFHKQFNVDMKNFDFSLYFGDEGFLLTFFLLHRKRRFLPLSIRDLSMIAQTAQWPLPDEDARQESLQFKHLDRQLLIMNWMALIALMALVLKWLD